MNTKTLFSTRESVKEWQETCELPDWEFKSKFILMLDEFQKVCGDIETHNMIQRFRLEQGLPYRPADYVPKKQLIEAGVPEKEIVRVVY